MRKIQELRDNGVCEAAIALRQWRLRFQVTQHVLARSAGLPESSVSAYESGRECMTLAAAEKIRAGCRRVGPPNAELGAFDEMLERMRSEVPCP
jgi:DNA-binding XRE family transcriptional regulator